MVKVQPEKIQNTKQAVPDFKISGENPRKCEFLEQMKRASAWASPAALVAPCDPEDR